MKQIILRIFSAILAIEIIAVLFGLVASYQTSFWRGVKETNVVIFSVLFGFAIFAVLVILIMYAVTGSLRQHDGGGVMSGSSDGWLP